MQHRVIITNTVPMSLAVFSLLSIVSDEDISVEFRPLCSLVREQSNLRFKASPAVDTEDDRGRSIRKAMAEIGTYVVTLLTTNYDGNAKFMNCQYFGR